MHRVAIFALASFSINSIFTEIFSRVASRNRLPFSEKMNSSGTLPAVKLFFNPLKKDSEMDDGKLQTNLCI